MSGRFVRASKFRHVHGVSAKKEKCFLSVKAETTGEGNYITASSALWAVALQGGGGPVFAGTHSHVGRIDTNNKINVHKAKVVDLEFSPFAETLLATASEDGTAKLTMIPKEGLKADVTTAVQTLEGHQKKLSLVRWHPTANNILSTLAYDNTVKVWDVESGKETSNQELPEFPISSEWNEDGSLLATSCKDKFLRLYDPRAPTAITKLAGLGGAKGCRVVWAGAGRLAAVGFQANNSRGIQLWDCKKTDKAISEVELDSSPGAFIPYYDSDLAMLYLVGKGDAAIKYWEIDGTEPHVHFLNELRENESIKGACFLPKIMCDTKSCEVAICYRVMKDFIAPVSFQVPRKSEMFQADIYPDTYAYRPVLTAADWLKGENKAPLKKSMKPGAAGPTGGVATDSKFSEGKSAAGGASAAAGGAGTAQLQAQLDAANARIKELEAEVAALKAAAGK